MRQIGTLSSEAEARRFAAYLVTEGLTAHAEQAEGERWVVWVRDENDVSRARGWLVAFQAAPDDVRYRNAEQQAELLARQKMRRRESANQNVIDMRRRWNRPRAANRPLVVALIALSTVVSLFSSFGKAKPQTTGGTILEELWFCSSVDYQQSQENPLASLARGQAWRAITPIFIHMEIMHLLFNMYMLYVLGGQVEDLRGTARLAGLVLAVAVISNVAQAIAPSQLGGSAFFGGMSGVNYGLFGYLWMKTLFARAAGFQLDQFTVIVLIGWLFLCMTGAVGNVANVAHVVGLVVGMFVGYLPSFWRR